MAAISEWGYDVGTKGNYRSHHSDHASDPAELLGSAPGDPTLLATEEEINLLGRMLYSEQAGQGPRIMQAAAWVAINRALDTENFPKVNSLADALIPGQFFVRSQEDIHSRIEAAPLEAAAWEQAQHIAREVICEYRAYGMADDLFDGALFFANVMRGDEAKEMYKELLKEAGVVRYDILEALPCSFTMPPPLYRSLTRLDQNTNESQSRRNGYSRHSL